MGELIDGILSDEMLIELHDLHLITWIQFVELHSNKMRRDYLSYCEDNGLDYQSDEVARLFLEDVEGTLLW